MSQIIHFDYSAISVFGILCVNKILILKIYIINNQMKEFRKIILWKWKLKLQPVKCQETLNFIQEREVTDFTTIFVLVYDSLVMSYYFDQLGHGCVLEPLNSYM